MEQESSRLSLMAYCPASADDDEVVFQMISFSKFDDSTDNTLIFYIVGAVLVAIFIGSAVYVVHRVKRKQVIQKQIVKLKEIKRKKKQLVL